MDSADADPHNIEQRLAADPRFTARQVRIGGGRWMWRYDFHDPARGRTLASLAQWEAVRLKTDLDEAAGNLAATNRAES